MGISRVHRRDLIRPAVQAVLNLFVSEYVIAEIGVHRGTHALQMCCVFEKNLAALHLIDNYCDWGEGLPGENYEIACKRLRPWADRCTWLIQNSVQAAEAYPDNTFHLIYIDGDHNFDSVLFDLRAWFSKAKPGCIVGGHDFEIASVAQAVEVFAEETSRVYYVHDRDWWFYK